jgi:hypothetical protein
VTSIRAVVLLMLCAAVAEAQSGDQSETAPPNDVFRKAAPVGSADTSTAGTDLFRRASVRRETSYRGQVDSVVIDGARVPVDTVRAQAAVSHDDITEHLARPVKAAAPVVTPAPVQPPPARPAPAPVIVAAPPVAPAPAAAPIVAPPVNPPAVPASAPAPAPRSSAPRTVAKLPPSTPTVKPPPPPDSAQLVREVAELQRDVAPKLQTVGVQIDSVRQAYEASLDRLAHEAPLPDTMEQRMLQATIKAARFKNDTTTPAAPASPTSKKAKKVKSQSTS